MPLVNRTDHSQTVQAEVETTAINAPVTSVRRISLRRFLMIVIIVSIASPALITGGFLILENYHRTIVQESEMAAGSYADLLQAGMTMPLWNVAPTLGEPVLNTVSIDPSVLQIDVRDADGGSFLEYHNEGVTTATESVELAREVSLEGEVLGEVRIKYSLAEAKNRATSESRLLITIIFIQLVFSLGVLSYFLQRRVIRPLTALEKSAIGIAGGDLKTSIPSLQDDEFGGLSNQLETMRSSLEQSFATLEERVKERTNELESLNHELTGTLEMLQQAQGNLVQQEKLAALGSLVAGVAHELNTPLGNGLTVASSLFDSTCTFSDDLNGEGITKEELDDYIRDMNEGTHLVVASLQRASELVSGFKQVAMDRTSAKRRQFNLLEVVIETRMTLSPVFKHTPFSVTVDIPDDIQMNSYPGPLGQVVTNLINNALIHAFEHREQGEITIVTDRVKMNGEDAVALHVADDGCGIKEEHRNRIFDPFFTTKLGAGGNGLGMHIVHNIVGGVLGGTIELLSEVGKGTEFIITIPVVAPEAITSSEYAKAH
ncbi:sensor histidine kinase [Teredinibacter waterburyi]|uniref:sensor histidine kinase n=1 Tax=Teredinibacter waterburyi TaxID=1500538 RepID=UPI001FE2DA90|nr:HAMP domain-containing sensor histidine kinase [Teredinibacter waterburyi]